MAVWMSEKMVQLVWIVLFHSTTLLGHLILGVLVCLYYMIYDKGSVITNELYCDATGGMSIGYVLVYVCVCK